MSTSGVNLPPTQWKILLIDDDLDNLGVVQQYFSFLGAGVKTACDGIEGLQVLEDYKPTLIMLDLSMPRMDGWQMLKEIRANPGTKSLPVIALTAHAMEGDREKVLEAGFDTYISKPIILPSLISIIETLTAGASTRESAVAKQNDAPQPGTSEPTPGIEEPGPMTSAPKPVEQAKPSEEPHASQQS